jgi:hypothetical protein
MIIVRINILKLIVMKKFRGNVWIMCEFDGNCQLPCGKKRRWKYLKIVLNEMIVSRVMVVRDISVYLDALFRFFSSWCFLVLVLLRVIKSVMISRVR